MLVHGSLLDLDGGDQFVVGREILTALRLEPIEDDAVHLVVLHHEVCLLYTSDAADERSSVDLGGRRIIKKKK